MTHYFEDLTEGETQTFGNRTVSRDEIVDFAKRYDPQPIHIDEVAAKESIYGGLVASGWHTVCMYTRMLVDEFMCDVANLGGRGAEDLRWHRPVRPGDTLSGRVEVFEKSGSGNLERGDIDFLMTCQNQDDKRVLTMMLRIMVKRRSHLDTSETDAG